METFSKSFWIKVYLISRKNLDISPKASARCCCSYGNINALLNFCDFERLYSNPNISKYLKHVENEFTNLCITTSIYNDESFEVLN